MDINDVTYFDNIMTLEKAYQITNFTCQQTCVQKQTVDNQTSLPFGRYTSFAFPRQYFNFTSYNQLELKFPTKTDNPRIQYAILTGTIRNVGEPIKLKDPHRY